LSRYDGAVDSVAFSPDGVRLLSGSADGTCKSVAFASCERFARLISGPYGDWLTPAGFFAASRKHTEMLGVVRGLEVIGVSQIH